MQGQNPYEAPGAPIQPGQPPFDPSVDIENVAKGQKLVIYAILLQMLTYTLPFFLSDESVLIVAGLVGLVALAISLTGVYKMSSGLGASMGMRILYLLLMFIPCANLITLLALNQQATKKLREAGYKVGLLGASR